METKNTSKQLINIIANARLTGLFIGALIGYSMFRFYESKSYGWVLIALIVAFCLLCMTDVVARMLPRYRKIEQILNVHDENSELSNSVAIDK